MNEQLNKHGIPIKCENCESYRSVSDPFGLYKKCWRREKSCVGRNKFRPNSKSLEARIDELKEKYGALDVELEDAIESRFRTEAERDKLKARNAKLEAFVESVANTDDMRSSCDFWHLGIRAKARALLDGKEDK